MIDFAILMWKPFVACLVLTGMHAYLGLHVVERKVIFVDLSLAQIAALGATVAILLGFDPHAQITYVFSLTATIIGAILFAITRTRKETIPHEAIIGIIYAVSAALAILLLSRVAEGDEELRHMLVGNILLVDQFELGKMLILYVSVGLIHWKFQERFLLISTEPSKAFSQNINVKAWDLLFYVLFGIVVTSSVQIAGVLLVFSFLIVPAVSAMLFQKTIQSRLIFGWIIGAVVSFLGIATSYWLDLPTGTTIVCIFGFVLILLALYKKLA